MAVLDESFGNWKAAVEKGNDPAAVRLRSVVKRFGKVVAVEKMDLDVPEGALVTLLGPSGCGKTTILRMIAGLEEPTRGDIFIKGERVNDIPIHKRNLGMIFQNYALFPHKTIFDNVAFGLKYRRVPKGEIARRVKSALEMVRLPGVEDRMPAQLSGGQQQRIALARAIVVEPDVLLMDEPLSALDENLREEMRREIDNLQKLIGVSTIFVTHDQREALSMSDKIVVMKDGRKQQEGTPEEVYNAPVNRFVADFLGHSNFCPGVVAECADDGLTVRLKRGGKIRVGSDGQGWQEGDAVEVVVRAQKFQLDFGMDAASLRGKNIFRGIVKDRSYMGGEVRYFVEIEGGPLFHVISMMTEQPFARGDVVTVSVDPADCRLLPEES